MTQYEIKAIVDGVVIERHIVNTLAEAESIANEWTDDAARADTDIVIDTA
jgi:hypothetical protein